MGGSRIPDSGGPANGILVHPHCHDRIESNREVALENGWLVSQSNNPIDIPLLRRGKWVFLSESGHVVPLEEFPLNQYNRTVQEESSEKAF